MRIKNWFHGQSVCLLSEQSPPCLMRKSVLRPEKGSSVSIKPGLSRRKHSLEMQIIILGGKKETLTITNWGWCPESHRTANTQTASNDLTDIKACTHEEYTEYFFFPTLIVQFSFMIFFKWNITCRASWVVSVKVICA